MPPIKSHSTATVDTAWDGPAQVAKASGEAELRYMHAWYEGENPEEKGSYKFPHHAAGTDTAANMNGVRNALARLPGSKIPEADKAGVEAHLQRHLKDGGGGQKTFERPHLARAEAYEGVRRGPTAERARMLPAPAHFKREAVLVNGKSMEQLDGYASVTGVEYEMYDMFGVYYEKIAPSAFDATLSSNPDVAFLVNHRGLSMARTGAGTLTLEADPRGLHSLAYVNPDRMDVRDLLIAIDDKNVTEMSFAFMLTDGEWDEEFMHFEIKSVDLDRGDVSAVNFGANPYTSIGARAKEILSDLEQLPTGARRAAWERLSRQFGEALPTAPTPAQARAAAVITADASQARSGIQVERQQGADGMSVDYVEQMLRLDE